MEKVKEKLLPYYALYFLFPISILELFCHAAFYPIMLFLYLSYVIDYVRLKDICMVSYLVSAVILSIFLGLFTPYGYRLPLYSLLSYGTASSGGMITELQHPSLLSINSLYIVVAIFLALYNLIKKRSDGVLLTFAGVFALALHVRNTYLLAVFLVPLIKCIATANNEMDEYYRYHREHITFKLTFFIPVALVILYGILVSIYYKSYCIADRSYTPVLAASYLIENKGTVYCDFDQGAFLEFNGINTYIDARPELYSKRINGKSDVYAEFLELYSSKDFNYNSFMEKYGFNYILTEDDTLLYSYLKKSDLKFILSGNGYALYEVE